MIYVSTEKILYVVVRCVYRMYKHTIIYTSIWRWNIEDGGGIYRI